MSKSVLILVCLPFLLILSCQSQHSTQSPSHTLLQQFRPITLPDTLHVWREMEFPAHTVVLDDSLVRTIVADSLLETISYYAQDSEEMEALGQFPLGKQQAAMIRIRYAWFVHIGLLLFDPSTQTFTEALSLSELDGGDGGQYLTESWLMDWDQDDDLDWVYRTHAHTLIMGEEDVEEVNEDKVSIFLWKNEQFSPVGKLDSAALIREFPIDW